MATHDPNRVLRAVSDQPKTSLFSAKRMEKYGAFLAILIFNVSIFIFLGSAVIYHMLVVRNQDPMVAVKVAHPTPPPAKPPSKSGDASRLSDPTLQVAPPTIPSQTFISSSQSITDFKVMTPPNVGTLDSMPSFTVPAGAGLASKGAGGGPLQANPFGDSLQNVGTPAFVGTFYDLKQTSDDPPVATEITRAGWRKEMLNLVANHMDETVLAKYLKGSDQRSSNGFSIPEQPSVNAPKAFGLDKKVRPSLWCIVYHGTAVAPDAGRFRFVGFGDDMLVIRLNNQVVFDGGWQFMTTDSSLHKTYPYVWSQIMTSNCLLRQGAWFNVDKGDQLNLDVAIGDWGGYCGFFLLLEQDGKAYDKLPDGTPKLPLFQLGAKLPVPSGPETPPAADSDDVWKSS